MGQILIIEFLKSFFMIFKAKIEEYKIIDKDIFGIIGWNDEDGKQEFVFKSQYSNLILSKVKILCDFLVEQNLINGDQIIDSEIELIKRLNNYGWSEIEAKEVVNVLCELDVKMIDNGEETDSFYVHF